MENLTIACILFYLLISVVVTFLTQAKVYDEGAKITIVKPTHYSSSFAGVIIWVAMIGGWIIVLILVKLNEELK